MTKIIFLLTQCSSFKSVNFHFQSNSGVVDNELGKDNKSLSILTYANGPGFYDHLSVENGTVTRLEIKDVNHTDFEYHQPSAAPTKSESHSGSDVGIFAIGNLSSF
jgi:hypothetical protein